MKIYVDADACPRPVKEILYKAVLRCKLELVMVANQVISLPMAANIRMLQVNRGFDEADKEIIRIIEAGDLLVTADIPLASEAVGKGALVINPRGKIYTVENIRQELATRDLMSHLRDNLEIRGGPPAYNDKDKANFANVLDKLLAKLPAN